MCFYNDYDWTADVVVDRIENEGKEPPPLDQGGQHFKCEECGALILAGSPHRYIYQQEHECCQNEDCGIYTDDELGEDEEGDCRCDKPDLGETFTYRRCMECDKFLTAVERAEHDEGCARDESRPSLGGMICEIQELERVARARYFRRARRDFPELLTTGYFKRLAKRVLV